MGFFDKVKKGYQKAKEIQRGYEQNRIQRYKEKGELLEAKAEYEAKQARVEMHRAKASKYRNQSYTAQQQRMSGQSLLFGSTNLKKANDPFAGLNSVLGTGQKPRPQARRSKPKYRYVRVKRR